MKKKLFALLIIALVVSGLQAQDAASKIEIHRTWISLNSEPEKVMCNLFKINDSPVFVPSSLKTLDYATSSYEEDSLHSKYAHRLGIYAELGGNGGAISGNIEYSLLFKKFLGIYLRGGMGHKIILGGDGNKLIESGFLLGKSNSFIDTGLGYTTLSNSNEPGDYKEYVCFLRLGYRYQGKKGFLFRAAPMIGREFARMKYDVYGNPSSKYHRYKKIFWFGISLGYSFQLNK